MGDRSTPALSARSRHRQAGAEIASPRRRLRLRFLAEALDRLRQDGRLDRRNEPVFLMQLTLPGHRLQEIQRTRYAVAESGRRLAGLEAGTKEELRLDGTGEADAL